MKAFGHKRPSCSSESYICKLTSVLTGFDPILETARFSLQAIQNFLNDTAQTQCTRIVSQDISVEKNDDTAVLQGSTISFACKDGFSNASGNFERHV